MARTPLPLTQLSADTILNVTDSSNYTTIDVTNGMTVTDWGKKAEGKVMFIVDHTTVSGKTMTVKAGAQPLDATPGPAFQAGMGDLTLTLTAAKLHFLPPMESARFEQADQCLYLDFAASTTGKIMAVLLPAGF